MYLDATTQRWRSFSAPTVTVGGVSVRPSSGARNLWVFFDNQLSLKQHISNVCKSCYFQLGQLRVIRRSQPSDVRRTLHQVFVTCWLDYCNSLLLGLPACDISRLQSVKNAARRLVGGVSRFDSVNHVFCAMISTGYQSSRESFSRSGCSDTRSSIALHLLTWRNCLFLCQMYRHWVETDLHPVRTSSFHPQQKTSLTVNEVLQWRDLPGGTTSLWKFATPVPCKLSVPDLRHFYLERLTTSLPHNPIVCFSWTLADLWTFIIIYTVSDLPYVMRLGMLA